MIGSGSGRPPFPVTLDNWQSAGQLNWTFQHMAEIFPTTPISRGSSPAPSLPRCRRHTRRGRLRAFGLQLLPRRHNVLDLGERFARWALRARHRRFPIAERWTTASSSSSSALPSPA